MRKLKLHELNRPDAETYRQVARMPLVVVLDNIRSGLNVGSAFRTADAFAVAEVLLCGITARPPHREIMKTAIGATETVSWRYFEGVKEALQELKGKGYRILAVEQTDESRPLQALNIQAGQPYALVFGNEVRGVSEEALPLVDGAVEIPQVGTKHSLNVSVCLGILCWTFFQALYPPR